MHGAALSQNRRGKIASIPESLISYALLLGTLESPSQHQECDGRQGDGEKREG